MQPESLFFQWSKRLAWGAFALGTLILIIAGMTCLPVAWEKKSLSASKALNPSASRRAAAFGDLPPTTNQTGARQASPPRVAILRDNEDGKLASMAATLPGTPVGGTTTVAISAPGSIPSTQTNSQLPGSTNRGPRAMGQSWAKIKPNRDGTNGLVAFLKLRTPVLHQAQLRDGTRQQNLIDLPGAICPNSEFVKRQVSPRLAILSFEKNERNGTSQVTILDGLYREATKRDHRRISLLGGLVAFGGMPNGSNTFQLFWTSF